MIGRTNLAAGGGEELNVFVQKDEPSKKDGVWVKTEEILNDNSLDYIELNDNVPMESYGCIQYYQEKLYLIKNTTLYVYDIENDAYSQLTDAPISVGRCVEYNGYLYCFGTDKNAYKYNIENNTYSAIASAPIGSTGVAFCVRNGLIYLIGSSVSPYYTNMYSYNPVTDTYTTMTSSSYELGYSLAVAYDNDTIFVIGGQRSDSKRRIQKLTSYMTSVSNGIPDDTYSAIGGKLGDYIYFTSGYSKNKMCKFNPSNNSITALADCPINFDFSSSCNSDNLIYVWKYFANEPSIQNKYRLYKIKQAVKTPTINKFNYETVNLKNISLEDIENADSYKSLGNVLSYGFKEGSAVVIKNKIYYFGGSASSSYYYKANYRDLFIQSNIELANIPYSFYCGSAVAIGTNIYLLGGGNAQYNYKYNTVSNSYTRLTNIPFSFQSGSAVAIGTDIYMFGSMYSSSYYYCAYKYDTLTDTYTQLTDIPYKFYYGSAVAVGSNIYIFGGSGNSYISQKQAYKYDTLTDTYTAITDIPYYYIQGSAVAVGKNIYLIGSAYDSTTGKYIYKYDTVSNEYTKLTDMSEKYQSGSAVAIGLYIYILGGIVGSNSGSSRILIYYVSNDIANDEVQILTKYPVDDINLSEKLKSGVEYAMIGQNGSPEPYPCYYGDGTNWNLIEK